MARSIQDNPQKPPQEPTVQLAEAPTGSEPLVVRMPIDVKSASLKLLAALGLIALLRLARDVFIPLVLAVLISYALDPLVMWLMRFRLNRIVASALVLILLSTGVAAGVYSLRDEALLVLDTLPDAARSVREAIRRESADSDALEKVQEAAREIEKTAAEAAAPAAPVRGVARVQVQAPAFDVAGYLWWGSKGAISFIGQLTVIFFLVFFLLASGDLYKRKLVKIAGPTYAEKKLTVQILREIDDQIEKFLLVQVLSNILVAVATGVSLWLIGVNQAAVWGIAAGVFNSIPYLGPLVVTGGLALVAFLQFGSLSMGLYVGALALVITSLEGFLLAPALMGKAARMNQVAIFVGLLFWAWMWEFWGAILAVPMMMAVKAVCDRLEGLRPIGELLGEKSEE
jgi:predicted PurR-regulated permease PerM